MRSFGSCSFDEPRDDLRALISCKVAAVLWTAHSRNRTQFGRLRWISPLPYMPLKSFIEVSPDSHFPLENLPFGVFEPNRGKPRVGVAVGDLIVDLSALEELGQFRSPEFHNQRVFSEDSLNSFLALGDQHSRKRARFFSTCSRRTPNTAR